MQKAIVNNKYMDNYKIQPLLDYKGVIGMTIDVDMNRPIGTEHPKHPGVFYPINYGFVNGLLGGDNEEQDVYVLGIDKPIKTFTGKIIAVVHRYDDIETKWVTAPDGVKYSIEEISKQIDFQEQFHKSKIIMT